MENYVHGDWVLQCEVSLFQKGPQIDNHSSIYMYIRSMHDKVL